MSEEFTVSLVVRRCNNMKKYIKQALAFLLVWFCSGITMYAYQTENKILGLSFTFLSFLYYLLLKDEG